MPNLDADLVRHALTTARDHGFAEVEMMLGEASFHAVLNPSKKKPKKAAASNGVPSEPEEKAIKATLVGILDAVKVEPGHRVEKGAVVAVVSALGLKNEVEASCAGEVVEVLVEAGQAVEYGQALLKVRP